MSLNPKLLGGFAATVALATSFAGTQAATLPYYAGGGTLAEKVYRDIFNLYGQTSSSDLCFGRPSCPSTPYNTGAEMLYVGVGSGNGKKAFINYDATMFTAGSRIPDAVPVQGSDFGPYFGTGAGSTWAPGLAPAYPKVSFVGSDDPLTTADLTTYNAKFGPALQFPALITPITVPFNPPAGYLPRGNTVSGSSSSVQLSTYTLCGIWTGAIRYWNDAEITLDNNGKQLGHGIITPIYRTDGSGSTFLFSNALLNQCGTQSHPVTPSSIPTGHSVHPVPDYWLEGSNSTIVYSASAPHYTSNNNFFLNIPSLPSNFFGAKGSGGVQLAVDDSTNHLGAIAYVSPDFVKPVLTGTDKNGNNVSATINLQTYKSFINNEKPTWIAPSAQTAQAALATLTPPVFYGSPVPAENPLNWAQVNPAPYTNLGFPIAGFTFIDMYSCYASYADFSNIAGHGTPLGLWDWYYNTSVDGSGNPTNTDVANTLSANGFAPVPGTWSAAIVRLLTVNAATRPGKVGAASSACTNVTSGA